MEYYKVAALIGTIVFLLSAFLPIASNSLFDFSSTFNLIGVYGLLGQGGEASGGPVSVAVTAYGILLTIILYPVAVILGIISIAKRKFSIAAGVLGIVCWVGALLMLSAVPLIDNPLQYTGLGVYIGFVGAIILAAAYFIKPGAAVPQATMPPPAPR